MKYYEGRANIDPPMSGAKYIKENKNKKGGEIYNFKNRKGKYYGYIPNLNGIKIDNLGAKPSDEFIKNVIVVFCATHPVEKGMRIVGWYKNAIVHRNPQDNSLMEWGYHIQTEALKAKLIDYNNRFCNIPNTFGRCAVFYFSNHPEKAETLNKILNYISNDGKSLYPVKTKIQSKLPRQNDINKRIQVEKKAISLATKYYSERYGINNVKSVEKDNMGWDLEIYTGTVILKVEVKGLSGNQLIVELTPNEYKAFDKKLGTYQLFIVTDALSKKSKSQVFTYQRKGNIWVGNNRNELYVTEIMSARISLK
ncbi:MAG: hypothetical protein A2X08_00700 [Bacteroidetes bacterium GWA2_32_17]|nr:MAG: hypothetical protein A2X08_00700 [Bacteroidetes bacterium GWA2_32_17]